MCFTEYDKVCIDKMSAYKIFSMYPHLDDKCKHGSLQSAFYSAYSPFLSYPIGKRIRVDRAYSNFYAFKELDSAIEALSKNDYWNFINGRKFIILPVTLYEVVIHGFLKNTSNRDYNYCYEGYASKEIVVHDNMENRLKIQKAVSDSGKAFAHYHFEEPCVEIICD